MDNIEILKQALPYIKRYRDKVFVVKLGGELAQRAEVLDGIAEDLSLLYQVGIQLVVIHGGGPQLSDLARRLGVESPKVAGRRITDDHTLELAKMVFAGGISTDILSALRRHGTPGVGLSGVDGDLIIARRRPPRRLRDPETGEERDVDFQNVGDIESIDSRVLRVLLDQRFVPVVASLGADREGKVLNINADTIACEIAACLPAEKLFLVSNVGGVLRDVNDPSSRISWLTLEDGERMLVDGAVGGGMMPKLSAAFRAIRGGVRRVHILSGLVPGSILREVFTVQGDGTMILPEKDEAVYLERG